MTNKVIVLAGTFNLPLLCEELFEAFPHWTLREAAGDRTEISVTYHDSGAAVIGPAELLSENRILEVAARHNHEDKSRNEKIVKKRDADIVSLTDKLRSLGLTDDEIAKLLN